MVVKVCIVIVSINTIAYSKKSHNESSFQSYYTGVEKEIKRGNRGHQMFPNGYLQYFLSEIKLTVQHWQSITLKNYYW